MGKLFALFFSVLLAIPPLFAQKSTRQPSDGLEIQAVPASPSLPTDINQLQTPKERFEIQQGGDFEFHDQVKQAAAQLREAERKGQILEKAEAAKRARIQTLKEDQQKIQERIDALKKTPAKSGKSLLSSSRAFVLNHPVFTAGINVAGGALIGAAVGGGPLGALTGAGVGVVAFAGEHYAANTTSP